MTGIPPCPPAHRPGLLARLLRDRAGNTLALAAAALFPLLGLIGGGVDMIHALTEACNRIPNGTG